MGKKKKKSFYKKLIKGNKVLIVALTGVAAGVTLTNVLGTEKAKQILNTIQDSISNFATKVVESGSSEKSSPDRKRSGQLVSSSQR